MKDLESTLVDIATTLKRHNVPYMVIGGFANLLWGEPRTTRDLDITVDVDLANWKDAEQIFKKVGAFAVQNPAALAQRTRVVPLITKDGIPVDVILAALTFELDAIARARQVEFKGGLVNVCTPEDLVVHKIISERNRDLDDVVGILRRQGSKIDLPRLKASVSELAATMEDATILERFSEAKRQAAGQGG